MNASEFSASPVRTALITGAAGGIGRALCQVFRNAGYRVIGTDRREDADGKCDEFIQRDILEVCAGGERRADFVEDVRRRLRGGALDVLINNAAIQVLGRTEEITTADWEVTLQTNLIAPFGLVQSFLPELEKARGSVINITSIHAAVTKHGFVTYATSKAALAGMTRALSVDLGPRVRINAISPGATATPMLRAGLPGNEAAFGALEKVHPMERVGAPVEIANTALFLASAEAGFITGSVINIDGGIGARLHDPW